MDIFYFDEIDGKFDDDFDEEMQKFDYLINGKYSEYVFLEFIFRRFFDDGGYSYLLMKEDLCFFVVDLNQDFLISKDFFSVSVYV